MYPVKKFIKIAPIDRYVIIIPLLSGWEIDVYKEIKIGDTYTTNLSKRGWSKDKTDFIYVEELKDWYPAKLFNITEITINGPRSTKR